jgi:hypothetical protein
MRISRTLQIALIAATAALAVLATPSARAGAPEGAYFLGDVNCDDGVDSIDGALLLQLEAALLDDLSCPGNADMNGDGSANSIDAGLVLQYNAGLILSRVQFSLNVTRPEGLCDDAEKPSVCDVPAGTEFGLSIALNHPPLEGYIVFQTQLIHGELLYNPTTYPDEEIVWPESGLAVRSIDNDDFENSLAQGALSSVVEPFRVSFYRGDLVRLSLTCPAEPHAYVLKLISFAADSAPPGTELSLPDETIVPGLVVDREDLESAQVGLVEIGIAARLRINCVE